MLLTFISFFCQNSNNNKLVGDWVAVTGQFMDGVILDITPTSITLVKALQEQTTNYKYKIEQDQIEIDTSSGSFVTLGKIVDLSSDKFKLASEESDTIEFIRLKSLDDNIESVNLILNNTCWKLQKQDVKYRIDFGDQLYFDEKSNARKALIHKLGDLPSLENVYWSLKEYKNQKILYISDASYNLNVYLIENINNDQFGVEYFKSGIPKEEHFERIQNLTEDKKLELINLLTTKKWRLNEFDTINTGESQILFQSQEINSLLNIEDLKNKDISFEFSKDKKIDFVVKDKVFKTFDWTLSDDGSFIWTDSNPTSKCIEIESLEKDELVINIFETIYITEENSAPICKLKLKLK